MIPIKFINGDATHPIGTGNKIICHICNDIGKWGKGFVLALSSRWSIPEDQYRSWYDSGKHFSVGKTRIVKVEDDIWVANMIGQKGIQRWRGKPPIQYDGVQSCLTTVAKWTIENNATIHMPRIGCGLAGGKWGIIEDIINNTLCSKDIEVIVYDLNGN